MSTENRQPGLGEVEVDLKHYLRVLVRRRVYVVGTLLGVLFLTAVITFTSRPLYKATGEILIRPTSAALESLNIPQELLGLMPSSRGDLSNEIQLIKSQLVLKRLSTRLAAEGHPVHAAATSGTAAMAEESAPGGPTQQAFSIDTLRGMLDIQQIPNTNILRIQAVSHSPTEAADVVNALIAVYQDFDRERARSSIQSVTQFLEEKIQDTEDQLKLSEQKLAEYAEEVQVALESQALVAKLSRLEQLLAEALVELEDKKTQLDAVDRFLEDIKSQFLEKLGSEEGSAFLLEVMDKLTLIRQIQRQIAEWESERERYLNDGDYIKAQELEQKIVNKRKELEDSATEQFSLLEQFPKYEDLIKQQLDLTLEIMALENRVRVLERQRAQEIANLNQHGLELARLQRELDVTQDLYELLLTEYSKMRVAEMGQLGSVEVINPAEPPSTPFKPNKLMNLFVGAVLGLMGGVGVAFLREALHPTFSSKEDVEQTLGLPVLASVPRIKHAKMRWPFQEVEELLITRFKPGSMEREAFTSLANNILYSQRGKPFHSILVTGPGPGIGKSVVAANLSLALSSQERKVLLLEADVRRPVLHKVFSLESKTKVGLTDVLEDKATLDQAVRKLNFEGHPAVYFLPAGSKTSRADELFSSEKFNHLLAKLAEVYDLIVMDSPPIHIASDAAIIGTRADVVLLVIESEVTGKEETVSALKILERYGVPVTGIVMNKVPRSRAGYYGYYYYHYGRYYHQEEETEDS